MLIPPVCGLPVASRYHRPRWADPAGLDIAALLAVIAAWFTILFTGRYPRGVFGFVEGVARWHNRVIGYAVTLVTDSYPPFRLAP